VTHIFQEKLGQAAVTAYASLLKARIPDRTDASIVLYNSHASHTIKWKVLVSNDEQGASTTFAEEKAEATLAAVTPVRYVLTGPFAWVDVQIASNTSGQSGEGNVWLLATGD
jgi:hypothetical protein